MAELLLELFSEEIPARMQTRAAEDLKTLVVGGLEKAGLNFERARCFVTPRRLTLVIDGLPAAQPDVSEERRGPRVGAPQQALDGFLKSAGISLEECEQRDTGKGEFYFAVISRKGRATAEVLKDVIEQTLADFPWPKSQRWASHSVRWVRPLHRILCLFAGEVVPVTFGPVTASDETEGHRFLAPEPFKVASFEVYARRLREAKVLLDQDERKAFILKQAEELARNEGLQLRADDGLLNEVAGLVEWPVVLLGSIDESFMDVPAEVLITSMRSHQKYFSLLKGDGSLAPRFVVVANRDTSDGGKAVVAGNQRVLRARLSDAKFFWDTDRKVKLDSRLPKLDERLFYAKLGTIADKVRRMKLMAQMIIESGRPFTSNFDDLIYRAIDLSKADLATEMVGEFPELQGVMGRYYALHDGEHASVAAAIADHYAPQGPSDDTPREVVSIAAALADKLDTLVGFFAIDERPTGSKDPFALRRAALGTIRIIVENGLRLPLLPIFDKHLKTIYDAALNKEVDRKQKLVEEAGATGAAFGDSYTIRKVSRDDKHSYDERAFALLDFFADRLKVHLREAGVRHDLITAVFALGGEDDLVRLLARVKALDSFVASEDGANLLVAYRRAANIVRIEEKKDSTSYAGTVDVGLLRQAEERTLAERIGEVRPRAAEAVKGERFPDAMAALALLRQPVDAFFDEVTVNTDDSAVRVNRLNLLSQIVAAMQDVADFSKIEG